MNGSPFTLRPMVAADKPAMMDIAAKIWDGGDYLPFLFDEWLADPEGEFAAVLLEGRPVGCGKLSFLAPGHAWMEGLRKDPEVKEGGLAEAVGRHFLAWLAARGRKIRSVRFSTYVKNLSSITANERLGFRLRLALSQKEWTSKRDAAPAMKSDARVRVVTDPGAVRSIVERSLWFEATGGLCPEGWRAYPYSWSFFRDRYVTRGQCIGVVEGRALRGVAAFVHDTRYVTTYLKLVFFDAEDRQTADLLVDALIAYVAAHPGDTNEIEVLLPPIERIRGYLDARGFASWEQENDFLLYELPLERLAEYAPGRKP